MMNMMNDRGKNIVYLKQRLKQDVPSGELSRNLLELYLDKTGEKDGIHGGEYRGYNHRLQTIDTFLRMHNLAHPEGGRKSRELYDQYGIPFHVRLTTTKNGISFRITVSVEVGEKELELYKLLNAINADRSECHCYRDEDVVSYCHHVTGNEDGVITERELLTGLLTVIAYYEEFSEAVRRLLINKQDVTFILEDLFGLPW